MNFLKNLFGGGGGRRDAAGVYFYIKPKACNEIVQVRVNMNNDLSLTDDMNGYFCRKIARGHRCSFPAELHLSFDKNRRLLNVEVIDGQQVSEEDYTAFMAEKGEA